MSNDTITRFLTDWAATEQRGDTEILEEILTDDFVGIGPLGFTLTKRQWLDRHAANGMKYDEFRLEDIQIRSYGDAVVAVALQTGKATYQGNEVPSTLRLSLVVTDSDTPRLAGIHMSFVAGTPGAPPIPGRG